MELDKSLDEIQASGVRFRQLSERANGMMVNTVVMDAPIPLFGGSGVYINGGTVGGLDLMAVFTKEFWNKKGRDNRARTLEVLRTYGDSTTVLINKPIEHHQQKTGFALLAQRLGFLREPEYLENRSGPIQPDKRQVRHFFIRLLQQKRRLQQHPG